MKKFLMVAPAVALIFACSGGGGGGASLQPGEWEMVTKMTDVQAPGAPPQVAEQMKAVMASAAQTQKQCLTEADVSNMADKLGQASANGGNCNFSKTTFAGGTIDIAGTCTGPTGNLEMTMTGSFTATTLTTTTTANIKGGPQEVTVTGTTEGRRLGDCPA